MRVMGGQLLLRPRHNEPAPQAAQPVVQRPTTHPSKPPMARTWTAVALAALLALALGGSPQQPVQCLGTALVAPKADGGLICQRGAI